MWPFIQTGKCFLMLWVELPTKMEAPWLVSGKSLIKLVTFNLEGQHLFPYSPTEGIRNSWGVGVLKSKKKKKKRSVWSLIGISGGVGGSYQKTLPWGGMDILWNYKILRSTTLTSSNKLHLIGTLADAELCNELVMLSFSGQWGC